MVQRQGRVVRSRNERAGVGAGSGSAESDDQEVAGTGDGWGGKRKTRRPRPDYQQEFVLTSLRLNGGTRRLLDEYCTDANIARSVVADDAILEYLARRGVNVDQEVPPGA